MNDGLCRQSRPPVEQFGQGITAGMAATVPMTIAMAAIQRLLPPDERTPQEPLIITHELLRRAGVHRHMSGRQQLALTLAAHFAYGAVCGAAYVWLGRRLPLPRRPRGVSFGLLVWAVSYAGWLPVLGILPPPHRRPPGRNLLLIASHLVWGAACESACRGGNDARATTQRSGGRLGQRIQEIPCGPSPQQFVD